jgi:hypothetical protein
MSILITRHLKAAGRGGSQAQIMADADGNEYFVKFKENGQSLKTLANEYLAGQIAKELQLPCPETFVVRLEPLLAPSIPPINGLNISEGDHFACKTIENLYNIPNGHLLIPSCKNKDQYPLIILFDVLLFNTDRHNEGNYLIVTDTAGLKFYIIDHGHCFNNSWNEAALLTYLGQWSASYFPGMYGCVTSGTAMQDAIQRIEELDNNFFTTLVSQIPEEWLPSRAERSALIIFLNSQRDKIRNLVEGNRSKFINWK